MKGSFNKRVPVKGSRRAIIRIWYGGALIVRRIVFFFFFGGGAGPGCNDSRIYPQTLFYLLRPLHSVWGPGFREFIRVFNLGAV